MAGSRSSLRRAAARRWTMMAAMTATAFVLAGCPKSDENKGAPAASSSAAASAAPATSASATATDAGAPSTANAATSYTGTYSVSPGAYYIPSSKDYANVKRGKDDPTQHVGEGTLALEVGTDGKVTGTVETGPAGPGVIEGSVIDGEIRGFIRRKDPSDQGLTGTFSAQQSGDTVEGKLSLAEANAASVREGKLSLKKK